MADKDRGSTKSVIVAMLANAGIAVAKFIGAAASGSASMMAEGFHSIADTGNQILLLVGIKRAKKPADAQHAFGYGRERYFWSFVVAITLFLLGGTFSILEGVHKLQEGEQSSGNIVVPLIVLALAAIFESYSFNVAYKIFNKSRHSRSFFKAYFKSKDPTIITVVSEDSAALIGITIAATGIVLTRITGHEAYDAVGSILIGLLLATVAFFLGRESKDMLIGESALLEHRQRIREICEAEPEVLEITELLTTHVSPNDILINLRIHFRPSLSALQLEKVIAQLERDIRKEIKDASRIFIEPHTS